MGNIMYKNLILLFKWWWQYSESDNALWKRILMSVYELKGLKASSKNFRNAKPGSWSHMMKADAVTTKIRTTVEEGMILTVGTGNTILFWHDKWCDPGPLRVAFVRLFSLSTQKASFISQMGAWNERSWSWNLTWRRALHDWEQQDVARLIQIIEQKKPNIEATDAVLWKGSGNTYFQVKCINDKLYESSSPILPKHSVKSIWQNHIPPRA